MYSRLDLIENEKMNKIIKENKERMSKRIVKKEKTKVFSLILTNILVIFSFIGFMYLIALIEAM